MEAGAFRDGTGCEWLPWEQSPCRFRSGRAWGQGSRRCCQTNANQSQFPPPRASSGSNKVAPLGQSGGIVSREI